MWDNFTPDTWTQTILSPVLLDGFEPLVAQRMQEKKDHLADAVTSEVEESGCTCTVRVLGLGLLCQWVNLTQCTELSHYHNIQLIPCQLSTLITCCHDL